MVIYLNTYFLSSYWVDEWLFNCGQKTQANISLVHLPFLSLAGAVPFLHFPDVQLWYLVCRWVLLLCQLYCCHICCLYICHHLPNQKGTPMMDILLIPDCNFESAIYSTSYFEILVLTQFCLPVITLCLVSGLSLLCKEIFITFEFVITLICSLVVRVKWTKIEQGWFFLTFVWQVFSWWWLLENISR